MNTSRLRSFLAIAPVLVLLQLAVQRAGADRNDQADLASGFEKQADIEKPGGFADHRKFKMFDLIDRNKDRKLTFGEFSQLERLKSLEIEKQRKLFGFLDRNSDGWVDVHELHPVKPRWALFVRREFHQFDKNADAQLDKSEFSALMRSLGKDDLAQLRLFAQLDENKNLAIDFHELGDRLPVFGHGHVDFDLYDKDANGVLDYTEYIMIPMVQRWPEKRRQKLFALIDVDSSGKISKSEVGKIYKHRRQSWRFAPHEEVPQLRDHKAF